MTQVAVTLRHAQRTHSAVDVELRDGSHVRGVPHSVCHLSVWLTTSAPEEDVFLRLQAIRTAGPAAL